MPIANILLIAGLMAAGNADIPAEADVDIAAAPSLAPSINLRQFLEAMGDRCWAIHADGTAVAHEDVPGLRGDIEIECLPRETNRREDSFI
ncbi:hypothetical protein KCG44_12840 [Pacificimonas sp. WHA3]|uniref:Uncharacterized protein n=1 Tax=Pacificimonas pallii TaxID=2827236 RepID=A0ABS6SII1_9SPHN|nr:hypothetical protein [Pacificimonas pallii]MBV7257672.1 hypothetical protein [Pacificimonas pallii]